MEWEKASPELGVLLGRLLTDTDCRIKPMFGAPVYFINDNMFCGIKGRAAFLRLSEPDRRAIMDACAEVVSFEPRPGFFMREYVGIPADKLSDDGFMRFWLEKSAAYTRSLPPKEKKARKPAATAPTG